MHFNQISCFPSWSRKTSDVCDCGNQDQPNGEAQPIYSGLARAREPAALTCSLAGKEEHHREKHPRDLIRRLEAGAAVSGLTRSSILCDWSEFGCLWFVLRWKQGQALGKRSVTNPLAHLGQIHSSCCLASRIVTRSNVASCRSDTQWAGFLGLVDKGLASWAVQCRL